MGQQDEIRVITPDDRTPGPPTPGMDRQQAFASDEMWAGFVRTEAGMMSGWHHHGDYESVIYVLSGSLTMEFGADGTSVVEAHPGDFLRVPKHAVHRESNPSPEHADIIVVRAGRGESTLMWTVRTGPSRRRARGLGCLPGRTLPYPRCQ